MIDVTLVDRFFDAAMDMTGRPPGTGMFDRRVLLSLEELPTWVQRESSRTLEAGRIDEIAAAGWFRLEHTEDGRGVPQYIASRIGLFLDLEQTGYTHAELREFAEFEDAMVDEIYTTDDLAFEDDDLTLLIDDHQRRLDHVESSIRVHDEPGWLPESGSWSEGGSRATLIAEAQGYRKALATLCAFREAGIPEDRARQVARVAYRIRVLNDFIRLSMVEEDRAQLRSGFSFFVAFSGGTNAFSGDIGVFDPPYPIDWERTVRRPWYAEDVNRRVFLPGVVLEGEEVRLLKPMAPSRYDDLWKLYDLDAYFHERAEILNVRVCLNCLSDVGEAADRRKKYCSDTCRNAAKQKRFRKNRPDRDLEHKRRYYSSLPEIKERRGRHDDK